MDNTVSVSVNLDDGGSERPDPYLRSMPIMDANAIRGSISNATLKSELKCPGTMNTDQFNSLFNQDVLDTIADKYKFSIEITTNSDSGYSFTPESIVQGTEYNVENLKLLITSLNNDNLLDNPYYMENHVSDQHEIVFSDGKLEITADETGIVSNAELISIDLTEGETLLSTYAGQNGQIKINTNTSNTRVTDFNTYHYSDISPTDINVYYAGTNTISDEMMHNPYLYVTYEKVALRSAVEPLDNVFLSDNNAFLTMYTNQVVNDQVDKQSITFSFNNNLYTDDSVRLWKLTSQSQLVTEPNSFYQGYDENNNIGTNLVNGICVQSLLQNMNNNLNTSLSYRTRLTAKKLEDIGLYQAVSETTNWSLSYSSSDFLTSNSTIAFSNANSLPDYNVDLFESINNGSNLYFKYEYLTQTQSLTHGGLQDFVQVSYSLNEDMTNATTYIVPQTDMNRIYSVIASQTITPVNNPCNFTSNNRYTPEQWQLVKVEAQSNFDVNFTVIYGVFDNITVNIADMNQTNTYYTLQNKTTLTLAPHSSLKYVEVPSISNLTTIVESISPASGVSYITGMFTSKDLKPLTSIIEVNINKTWNTASTSSIDFDVYYGFENSQTLSIPVIGGSGDVVTSCDYSPLNSISQTVNLSNFIYYIPFVYNPNDSIYSVSSFVSSPYDIPNNTYFADEDGYLSVTTNYDKINSSWSSNNFTVSVSDDINNVTTFKVNDLNNNTVFTITKQSNNIFFGSQIVTYIPQDIYRTNVYSGESDIDNSLTQVFQSTNYTVPEREGSIMTFDNTPGIEVTVNNTEAPAGARIAFRVLGDFVSINEVGTVDDPYTTTDPDTTTELGNKSYNNGSLVFQYGTGETNYSAKFSLDRYRGWGETATSIQQYTINRYKTTVTFNVINEEEPLNQLLTSNMYYGEPMVVNNLVNLAGDTCANLNISFSALYSLYPSDQPLTYPVSVDGDDVKVTISNTKYLGGATNIKVNKDCTSVEDPAYYENFTTLNKYSKDDMYTFSGNFLQTGNFVALRPSRVKMYNAYFPANYLEYSIALNMNPTYVYKAKTQTYAGASYLGNPSDIDDNGAAAEIDDNKWELMYTLSDYTSKLTGVNIGKYSVKQNPAKYVKHAVSYYVSAPTYYKYESVSTENNLVHPYDHNSLNADNIKNIYMAYDESNTVFNPFAPVVRLEDVMGNSYNIYHDPLYVNNITITHLKPKTMFELTTTADTTRYGISVPGVNLKIELFTGLYNSELNSVLIYDGPVTSIPATPDILSNLIVFRNRDDDGSINFSVAQNPEDIGYSIGLTGYKEIFRTDNQTYYYNIDFKIGNACWFNNNEPVTWFNAIPNGVRPTLYTVVDVNDPIMKVNSRRVYKYTSNTSLDSLFNIEEGDALQTISLMFREGRSYYDVQVTLPNYSTDPLFVWNYSNLVTNTNLSSNEIQWVKETDFLSNVYVNWSFGNSVTGRNMPNDLFNIEKGENKWVYITLLPFQSFVNQFGLTISETSWDGSLYTPLVSSQVVTLNPSLNSPSLNNITYQTEQYSISTLN